MSKTAKCANEFCGRTFKKYRENSAGWPISLLRFTSPPGKVREWYDFCCENCLKSFSFTAHTITRDKVGVRIHWKDKEHGYEIQHLFRLDDSLEGDHEKWHQVTQYSDIHHSHLPDLIEIMQEALEWCKNNPLENT